MRAQRSGGAGPPHAAGAEQRQHHERRQQQQRGQQQQRRQQQQQQQRRRQRKQQLRHQRRRTLGRMPRRLISWNSQSASPGRENMQAKRAEASRPRSGRTPARDISSTTSRIR